MDAQLIPQKLIQYQIFKDLQSHPEALNRLASIMKQHLFQGREPIIEESRIDDRIFFLLDGQVVINKVDEKGQIVIVGRADSKTHPYFGESVLLGKNKRTANVIAHSQCECLSLSAEDFDAFMKEFPFVAASIYRNMASVLFDRLAKTTRDLFIAGLE